MNTCPNCKREVSASQVLCGCGCDLTLGETGECRAPISNEVPLLCSCGHQNPQGFVLCQACGRELAPQAIIREEIRPTTSRLWMLVGDTKQELKPGDILGRAGTAAAELFDFPEVSNWHVHITYRAESWFVAVNPSAPNSTLLDGREIQRRSPHKIFGEHVLRLSSKCEVKLKVV